MTRSAVIIGAGQIGYAAACAFRDRGWDVAIHARSQPRWHDASLWRYESFFTGDTAAPSADVVLDTIAFDAQDVDRYDPEKVGRLIVVSSASVYCDNDGRTLDEGAQNGFPEFDGPITEDQSTVAPGPETYSTRKIRMEQRAIELFGNRVTILRPCAIYGPHSRHPREWWFVKRMLDGRRRIPLACSGTSQFQTTNADLIGEFVVAAAENKLGGIYNIADVNSPMVGQIGEAIARLMKAEVHFEALEGYPDDFVGRTPWSVPHPFVIDGSKAKREANLVRVKYEVEVRDAVDWLANLKSTDWRGVFPQLAAYPWDLFDYKAEDALLETS